MAGAPVTEVFYDQDFGEARTRSALIRAIWQVKDDIAVDFAFVVYALTSIRPARSAPASPLLSRYADLRAENRMNRMRLLRLIGAFLGVGIGVLI
jgi:hypothetical protein